ncbi:MAG TPA: hypothetical protein VD968_02695 [Pyrinomonadaceae bacterium]|nr:hypothetical protein [Pyrinomonadaceae bacterium]
MHKRLLLAATLAAATTLLSPSAAVSQTQGPPTGAIGDKNLRNEADPARTRSNELDRIKRDADKPAEKAAPSFPQIKEDFERIQLINSEVLQAAPRPDYKRIADAAAEIKKRASRLSANLFPPEAEKQSKARKGAEAEEPQELKALLAAVDGAIISFVNNPVFQNTKVVNPEDSARARGDLERVVKLSGKLSKEADRLSKSAVQE